MGDAPIKRDTDRPVYGKDFKTDYKTLEIPLTRDEYKQLKRRAEEEGVNLEHVARTGLFEERVWETAKRNRGDVV